MLASRLEWLLVRRRMSDYSAPHLSLRCSWREPMRTEFDVSALGQVVGGTATGTVGAYVCPAAAVALPEFGRAEDGDPVYGGDQRVAVNDVSVLLLIRSRPDERESQGVVGMV